MDLADAGCRARFLLRDRDGKFPGLFDAILADAGIDVVLSGVRMPRMNSIMERWVQTCRRELLDRTLIWPSPTFCMPCGSSRSSTTGTGRIRASRTPGHSSHCPYHWWFLTKSPALTYDDATDSVEYSMSTTVWHELHG
jgi:transposase InsO family protein